MVGSHWRVLGRPVTGLIPVLAILLRSHAEDGERGQSGSITLAASLACSWHCGQMVQPGLGSPCNGKPADPGCQTLMGRVPSLRTVILEGEVSTLLLVGYKTPERPGRTCEQQALSLCGTKLGRS